MRRVFDPVRFWSKLDVVERHNVLAAVPGAWSVTARNEGLTGLLTAGNGVILFRGGVKIMSGPIVQIDRGAQESTVSGWSDLTQLAGRGILPDPAVPVASQTKAYDNRSGPAETVLLGYTAANAGPTALPGRRIAKLRVPATQGRGKNVSVQGRFDQLLAVVADVAESGGLHVDILHSEDASGPYLEVVVRPVADLSGNVRFGTGNDFTGATIGDDWSYTLTRPTVTSAIVAGGGEGAARVLVERTSADAETTWGARVEQLIDQASTTNYDELVQAGDDALADGAEPVSISFTVADSVDVRYRRDWQVGDRVAVSLDGLPLTDVVREVTTTVERSNGQATETITGVVGSRDASNWTTKTNKNVAKALRAIDRLQAS
nr:siphovirus ReqiPepy6 Gp37-like family protein [Curtobacterium sp. WW7]